MKVNPEYRTPTSKADAKSILRKLRKTIAKLTAEMEEYAANSSSDAYTLGVLREKKAVIDDYAAAERHFVAWLDAQEQSPNLKAKLLR